MKKITRTGASSKADLEFGYDASGNRLWKKVTPKGSGAVTSTYYYLRDAQGNEMCRYVKYTNTTSQLMYVAEEHSIYGSSRVGVDNRKDTLYMGAVYTPTWGGVGTSRRDLGSKSFELANHLGNVLVTVSDKPVYKVSSGTIYFQPEVTSISDYYPFGAPITGRGYSSEAYRFGFNTQEKTDEISGPGNHNTATFWEYDTRLGRRWNTDPVIKPWESLYACLSNNPLLLNDPDGSEPIPYYVWGGLSKGIVQNPRAPTQWYALGGVYDSKTFNSAAAYSTQYLKPDAFQTVYQRNAYYGWAQSQSDAKGYNSKWFGAAQLVTGLDAVGGTEIPDGGLFSSSAVDKFLQGGNKFLFTHNMKNAQDLLADGKLSGGFTDANGATQSFNGLTGMALDNKMVEFEQSKVQEYIGNYKGNDLNSIISGINDLMSGSLGPSAVKDVMKNSFNGGKSFDFKSYKDRVKLGQELIKKAHNE